jgi:hypothetical protein
LTPNELGRLRENTTIEGLKGFVSNVKACFKAMYLRQPIRVELLKYIRINEARGFSSMLILPLKLEILPSRLVLLVSI